MSEALHFRKTHEVLNQPPALSNTNLFTNDLTLQEGIRREGAAWASEKLSQLGKRLGSEELQRWGFQANQYTPVLKTHDRFGHRIDEVEFHPAWHELMRLSVSYGLHSAPWSVPQKGAHVARAAMMMLAGQNEYGHLCPISMTYSIVPLLQKEPTLAKHWIPKIYSTTYDSSFQPSSKKQGVILGMAMTEKQGGSDVRANTSTAVPLDGSTHEYRVTGHKWFCSAPMSDGFMILAQAPGGLTCFFLPRWMPDEKKNHFFIQRLKDKLGNRSNASSEIEFDNAWAYRVGDEGRGVSTIIEMVNHTRLDCVISSTGMMRHALLQAFHHCTHRRAFGKTLTDHSLMQNVLADLTLESEAATLLMLRLARAYDAPQDSEESSFRRIATAISKYWICKRNPVFVTEALECFGGSGIVEETILARLYRDAPVNSIWEGSGNVICLDVARAMKKEPDSLEALWNEIALAKGQSGGFDRFISALTKELNDKNLMESQFRGLVEKLVLALQASLLIRFAPPTLSEGFCHSRLEGNWGRSFGSLSSQVDTKSILERIQN